jgi:ferric-dicitrate binding protein FerR (iron transport regulator)
VVDFNEHIDELLAKQLADRLTPDEQKRIDDWAALSAENLRYAEEMKQVWQLSANAPTWQASQADTEKAWQNVRALTVAKPKSKVIHLYRWVAVAASIALLVSVWWLWPQQQNLDFLVAETGATSQKIVLADGSEVILLPHSKLDYPNKFGAAARDVTLNGNAQFTVKGDANRPFKIAAATSIIEVVGTKFLVSQALDSVFVRVVEGTVKLYSAAEPTANVVTVTQGEAAFRVDEKTPEKVQQSQAAVILSDWLFDAVPLSDVLQQVGAVYNITFTAQNPELLNCALSAKFTQANLDEVLQTLSLVFGVEVVANGREIVLIGKGC